MDIVLLRQLIPKYAVFRELSMKLIPKEINQMKLRLSNQFGIEFHGRVPFGIVTKRLTPGATQYIHRKPG
jgi:hypothetical protein